MWLHLVAPHDTTLALANRVVLLRNVVRTISRPKTGLRRLHLSLLSS